MSAPDFENLDNAETNDAKAWRAICDWPKAAGFDAIHDGYDYAELVRSYLWDKVGRSVRVKAAPKSAAFEKSLMGRYVPQPEILQNEKHLKSLLRPLVRQMKHTRDLPRFKGLRDRLRGKDVLYLPFANPRLEAAVSGLAEVKDFIIASQPTDFASLQTAVPVKPPAYVPFPPAQFERNLLDAIREGLNAHNVELFREDTAVLRAQIRQLLILTAQADFLIQTIRPSAILVYADNHPPLQSYVFAAQKYDTQVVMLQHGLDCEHFFLDEVYADRVAVWGEARKRRYQRESRRQAAEYRVTGNPAYDRFSLPDRINRDGDYWLWVTRPHAPEKCLLPSRPPDEGLQILRALLQVLGQRPAMRLVIKPHPYDYRDRYEAEIENSPAANRVNVVGEPVLKLLENACGVVTEDSTAGMEAMFFGRPLVYAHFAKTPPKTPFADLGAAFSAFSAEEMPEAIEKATADDGGLVENQRVFLQQFAGPMDGQAASRVHAFIHQSMRLP